MNKEDLRQVVEQLETLDSLTRLFKNLWFEKVKEDIEDEKVKAYLMVFDDAFPGMNHVIEFVRNRAQALANGDTGQVRKGFEALGQLLLKREIETDLDLEEDIEEEDFEIEDEDFEIEEDLEIEEEMFEEEALDDEGGVEEEGELTREEKDALEKVDQDDIDALFSEGKKVDHPEADTEAIDALFNDSREESPEAQASRDEIEALLASQGEAVKDIDSSPEEEVDLESLLGDEDEEEIDDLEEVSEAEEEVDLESLLGDEEEEEEAEEEVDLESLLGDEDDEEEEDDEVSEAEEEVDLESLLGEEEDDEMGDVNLESLLGDEDDEDFDIAGLVDDVESEQEGGVEISEDEMTALLGDEEEEAPRPKKKPDKAVQPRKKANKARSKAKRKDDDFDLDDLGNGEESISQDEIDALFG